MAYRHKDHVHNLPLDDPSMTEQVVWFRDVAESVPTCALGNLFTEQFVAWVCQEVDAAGSGCPDIMAKLQQALQREADAVLRCNKLRLGLKECGERGCTREQEMEENKRQQALFQAECEAHLILLWKAKAQLLDALVRSGELELGDGYGR